MLPVPISEGSANDFMPEHNFTVVKNLRHFIAEDAKTARRFLKWFGYQPITQAQITLLNEHTRGSEITSLLDPIMAGNDMGLMSDAGCPGIADPGADVVKLAHQRGVDVVPLVGPSSIVLSIMASGFNGQNFSFTGYLPIDKPLKIKRLRELELMAQKQSQAQFFIETPYRNMQLLETMLETLQPATLLFVGTDITSPGQKLLVRTIAAWKKSTLPELHKVPTVFGIYK
ncbi:MAG: SAM-dependent methyltransferase [Bacteroidota bacterium]